MEPAPHVLGPGARAGGADAHLDLQGYLHRLGHRRGRRQPHLCQYAVPCQARVFRPPTMGRPRGLGAGAATALRHRRAHAGRADRALGQRWPAVAARARPPPESRADFHAHALRRLLRRCRPHRARPLFRRRGPVAHRLHTLRQLHDGLPGRGEKYAGEELPVVCRESGRAGVCRNGGHRYSAVRQRARRRRRRLSTAPARLDGLAAARAQAPACARRGRGRRGTGHEPPARALSPRWWPAQAQPAPGREGAHQQRSSL